MTNTPSFPTLDEACDKALAYHRAGQLAAAEQIYRAILQAAPKHPAANHLLGLLSVQLQQPQLGLPHLLAALEAKPETAGYWLDYIDALLLLERTDEARQVLALGQQHGLTGKAVDDLAIRLVARPSSWAVDQPSKEQTKVSANIPPPQPSPSLKKEVNCCPVVIDAPLLPPPTKQPKLAKSTTRKGIHPSPKEEATLLALFNQGRYSEGVALAQTMTEHFPLHGFGWKVLGGLLSLQGHNTDALLPLQKAAQLLPQDQQAQSNLGVVLAELNRFSEAEASHRRALAINPHFAESYCHLGAALKLQDRIAEAETCLRQAIALKPDYAPAQFNLGVILYEKNLFKEAEAAFIQALACDQNYAEACLNLAVTLEKQGQLLASETICRRALALKVNYADAEKNLGGILSEQGCFQEAEICFRRALALKPDWEDIFSHLLFLLNYEPDKTGEEIFAAYREYDERFCQPLHGTTWRAHPNNQETARRLKVGYVSPDFCAHPVRYFLEPLLEQHDKQNMEIYAYAELTREDEATARYKNTVDYWIPTRDLSDEALADRIRADQIDILVDLAGHTAHNRLQVFARKPAPVSVSWLGYGYTTGLTAIDYFLTDAASAPPGSESVFSEIPWRLATPAYVYRPAVGMGPVGSLPASERGHITFGTLTRAIRINHRTIRAWSAILKRVVGSRLAVNSRNFQDPALQEALVLRFAAHGIRREQLDIGCYSPPWDVLRGFDIGLDCFPHNSGTTLFETLYMGVPYITLAGRPSVGRLGSSILEGIGHPEWIAFSEEEYIEKAVALASDLPKLAELRAGLRQEMETGPLMDEAAFARKVETAYREMFARWATGQQVCEPEKIAAPALSPLLDDACDKAIAYHCAGELDAAEQVYRAILQAAPQHPVANHFLGLLIVCLRQPEAALPYLLSALEANPTEADYWLAYLDALLLTGQTNEAQQVLELGRQHGLEGKPVDDIATRLQIKKQEETPLTHLAPTATLTTRKVLQPSAQEEATLLALFNQERYEEGVDLALKMTENFPEHGFGWKVIGALFRSQGNSAEALLPLQKSAQLEPQDAQAQSNLGLVLSDLNRLPEAEACHRQALAINPRFADAHNNLGTTLKLQGRLAEAEASFQTALALNPDYAEAQNNLGVTLYEQNRLAEAETAYRAALSIQPDYAEAYNNLGNVLGKQDRPAEAETNLRRALEYRPHFADAHYNLASTLRALGLLDEAIGHFRQALILKPDFAEAHINLGVTLNDLGRLNEAENSYRAALAVNANYAEAYHNLGNVLGEQGRGVEARDSYQKVLQLRPDSADAYSNLGYAEFALGESDLAEFYYRRAIELNPDLAEAHTSLLFALSHKASMDTASLFAEHCRFGEQFEAPLRASWPQHPNTRDPDRCLQVGFVSADLRNHAIANFIEPVLAYLAQFPTLALHAYYTHTVEDGVTQRLRTYLKHWHPVAALSDADLAQKIREDEIDILIDLSGHTGHNRLLTFARKPAPVQASWMGYPGTTGLQAMDYYIADRHYLPPEQFAHQFTEKLAYLPASAPFLPFKAAPPVNALPALRAGYITFGSFNRLSKLSASTIALWSSLLRALPEAKMLLGGMPMKGGYDKLIDSFSQEGIARDRLNFYPRSSMDAYLALHHQVDICLDTYPYAGGTTTLHALWMGVPTLSVAGLTPAGRAGASILSHVGLDAFIAQDAADFVNEGISWAKNLVTLADLRTGLRARCNQSATRHPEAIAASLERALRMMWQHWCKELPVKSFIVIS